MAYALGARSRAKLAGVCPRLVAVVERAIAHTTQDFCVTDGVRTLEQQRALVARGASKTLNSRHRVQADGFGHAVDLAPWHDGAPRWEWPLIYPIAAAMREAAEALGVALTWGGVWDRSLQALDGSAAGLAREVRAYAARHPGPDLLDGPHYELR